MYIHSVLGVVWNLNGLLLFCALTGVVVVAILISIEIGDNAEAPFFALIRYAGRAYVPGAIAEIPRLAPVLLVSLAIFFLLIVPLLARAGTDADRLQIEQQIMGYLSDAPDDTELYPLLNLPADEELARTRQLLRVRQYQSVKLSDVDIDDDTASVYVQLARDDGAVDSLILTCQRDSTGWRIWAADFSEHADNLSRGAQE